MNRVRRWRKNSTPRRRNLLRLEPLECRALLDGAGAAAAAYGQLPLSFEINQGQAAPQVNYLAHGPGYGLFLTPTGAELSLQSALSPAPLTPHPSPLTNPTTPPSPFTSIQMQLIGANPGAKVSGLDQLPGVSNYLIGNDPAQWHTGIATYGKVEYQNLYSGVNLVYYGKQRQLEYDFSVAAGADPSQIAFDFSGAQNVSLDGQGNLVLHTAGGDVVEHAPVAYQTINGARQAVEGHYQLAADGRVGFAVGAYDHSRPLVIDPVLSYSTYLGGSGADAGSAIAVDSAGDAYIAGSTDSSDFPIVNARQGYSGGDDAVVTKLSPSGLAVIYSTYLGGSGSDQAEGIAIDSAGNAYVTGNTASTDFPTTSNAFQRSNAGQNDAFVVKLNATGSALVYSTYLGGGNKDYATGIAVDSAGNPSVSGITYSSDFPIFNAYQSVFHGVYDAFVSKLNAVGSALLFSTFLGGNKTSSASGVAVDSTGVYVTGATDSTDFPTTPGTFQTFLPGKQAAFVSKLNSAGALVYSTYFGGEGTDQANAIALYNGQAFVAGETDSFFFPTTSGSANGATQPALKGSFDAFVTQLNSDGTKLVFSTYLGGSGYDDALGIAVDSDGRTVFVTGFTSSADFLQVNAVRPPGGGPLDAFVDQIDPFLEQVVYSTYLGGSGIDEGVAIALDPFGSAYIAGLTTSADFPMANAVQPKSGGSRDGFVAKIAAVPLQITGVNGVDAPGLASITLASFTDNRDPTATADEFSATIDWGDGQTTSGNIAGSSGAFTVQGTHDYHVTSNSTFSVVVTVQDKDGDKISALSAAFGEPPPPPRANNDSFELSYAATSSTGGAYSVLANDTSADGQPQDLRAVLAGPPPAHGSVTLNADGSFSYTSNASFRGLDRFRYVANESGAIGDLATVTLISPQAAIVDKLYHQVLGRPAEDDGLQYWANLIMRGASYSVVAEGIFESDERLNAIIAGGQLGSISYPGYYPQFLLRPAEPDGLAFWKSIWKRDGGPDRVISGMISSPEFYASAGRAHPTLSPNAAWVTVLYERLLGREPEPGGLQFWTGNLDSGTMTEQGVVLGFVQSDENFRNLTAAFFQQYLSRPPTSAEQAQYVAQFKAGGSQRDVQKAIINSVEYQNTPPPPSNGTVGRPLYPR